MLDEVFCIASTEAEAQRILSRLDEIGVDSHNISVVTESSEMDRIAPLAREIHRQCIFGFAIGGYAGWCLGIVLLLSLGPPAVGWGEALLLPVAGAMGGAVFGTLIGASGVFCSEKISPGLAHQYEEEVGRGGILISVGLFNRRDREKVKGALESSGAADIHYSDEIAA